MFCSSVDGGPSVLHSVPHVDLTEPVEESRPSVVDLTETTPTAPLPPILPQPPYVFTVRVGIARSPSPLPPPSLSPFLPPLSASMPMVCCDLGVYFNSRCISVQLPATATVKQVQSVLVDKYSTCILTYFVCMGLLWQRVQD